MSIPLAERIRPRSLNDYLSQKHLIGKNGAIKSQLDSQMLSSMIFWGPQVPGKQHLPQFLLKNQKDLSIC